ncbi:MAG: class I SAM-dependent methyltransferase [Cyanobacteria bacterium J06560_2]
MSAEEKITEGVEVNQWQTWYNNFDENYGPEERRKWYSQAAKAYRWARPTYPDALVDEVIRKAGLTPGNSVLEMGCGPGIATRSFAERGLAMQCVEPSPAACELARQTCVDYDDVAVTNSTFEDFPLAGRQFDAVLAATSFHWVAPEVACQKSAAALKPGGSLILLWATPPQPSQELCDYLQPVYERYQLADTIRYQWRDQAYYQTNFEAFARVVGTSGWFGLTDVDIAAHHSEYSIEKYIALLSTLSDYIALPEDTRTSLLADLSARLAERQGHQPLALDHWFAAQVAPLI